MNSRRALDFTAIFTLVVLCASWGAQQVAVKIALQSFPPFLQMGLRSACAMLLVAAYCVLSKRGPLFVRDGTLWPGLFSGLLFAGEFVLIYVGLQWTDASRTSLLLYTAPFFVALGAHWMLPAERLWGMQWLGLLFSFAGIVVVMGVPHASPTPNAIVGDLMIVGAAALWAATTLTIKTTSLKRALPEKVLLYQLAVSAVVGIVWGVGLGETVTWQGAAPLAAFTYQTIWVAAITFVLWLRLVSRYPVSMLQAATSMTPLFGVAFAAWMLGEHLSMPFVLAVALMIAGLLLVNRPRRA